MIELIKKIVTTKEVYKFVPGMPFNPNFDGNAIAWYDGDVALDPNRWDDQGAGGHDIIFANLPTIVPNALNTHQIVRFDGINENGVVATPVTNQPYTIYIVLSQLAWALNNAILDDGAIINTKRITQSAVTPQLRFSTSANIFSNPSTALNTFGVVTTLANGVNSEIRTNLNASVIGNAGLTNSAGITLASRFGNIVNSNIEVAYLIIRTGADSTVIQNRIINSLMNRFAL